MSTKNSTHAGSSHRGAAGSVVNEEILLNDRDVSLCLLLHRHSKTMRIVDFRAGPSERKRTTVIKAAEQQGIEKVFTLVERDEIATWTKLGFKKEATIPGFYKRSDAYLVGSTTDMMRRAPSEQAARFDEEDDEIEIEAPGTDHNDRTLARAKRLLRDLGPLPSVKLAEATEASVAPAFAAAKKDGRALTGFEPFGRDVERRFFRLTHRSHELIVSSESQACFSNAFIELLTGPRSDAELSFTAGAIKTLCDRFLKEGVVSCFTVVPSDDERLATAFLHNGFRRTGVLQSHLAIGKARKDAFLFSRKLANPLAD